MSHLYSTFPPLFISISYISTLFSMAETPRKILQSQQTILIAADKKLLSLYEHGDTGNFLEDVPGFSRTDRLTPRSTQAWRVKRSTIFSVQYVWPVLLFKKILFAEKNSRPSWSVPNLLSSVPALLAVSAKNSLP